MTEGSVAEMAPVREDHRRAGFFDRVDDVLVTLGAAWLDERRDAGLESHARAVREREERVRRQRRARRVVAELPRLLDRDLDRIHPAHLTGADADRLQVLREP